MITLYAMDSPNVHKVTLMLEELEYEYEVHFIDVWNGEQFTQAFRSLNPNSKVPVLIDTEGPDGRPITIFESGAILIYLAEKSGRFLAPSGVKRIAQLEWMMIQMTGVGPMFGQHVHFTHYAPEPFPYPQQRYRGEAVRLVDLLEERLGAAEFLGGEDYSIADIATYPWIRILHFLQISLETRPNLLRWKNLIADRSAAHRLEERTKKDSGNSESGRAKADADKLDRYFGRGAYARDAKLTGGGSDERSI